MSIGVGAWGEPGVGAAQFSVEAEIMWGGNKGGVEVLYADANVSSEAVDAGSVPTNVLRKGLLMGRLNADGKLVEWDSLANDGSADLRGVLDVEQRMVDGLGIARGTFPRLLIHAPLKASKLLIKGAAMIGHADEYLARRNLHQMGFRLDDDPVGYLAGLTYRQAEKTTNYTVVAADNGTFFIATTAAVVFTLPAIKPGLSFTFFRYDAFTMGVVTPTPDDLIVGNDNSADSVTWQTAGNMVGACVRVRAIRVGAALRWLPEVAPVPFSTGTLLTQTLAT
jgi:hypothetical protein